MMTGLLKYLLAGQTSFLGQEDMEIGYDCHPSLVSVQWRGIIRETRESRAYFVLGCQYFWFQLIAKFPENIWLVMR